MGSVSFWGQRIQKRREALKLSQEEFASKVGISLSSLRRYEAGLRSPTGETIENMAHALGIDLSEFMWVDPATNKTVFWTHRFFEVLKQVDCSVEISPDDDYKMQLTFMGGTLEIAEEELNKMGDKVDMFLRFLLYELREAHKDEFKALAATAESEKEGD